MIIISTLRSNVKLFQYRLKFIGQDQRVKNEDFQAIILKPQKPGKSNKTSYFY